MLTQLEKNIAIASMQSAILYAHTQAGISSFGEIESRLVQLRADFDADPDSVTEYDIMEMWTRCLLSAPPSLKNLKRIWRALESNTNNMNFFPASGGTLPVWFRNNNGGLEYSLDEQGTWSALFSPKTHEHFTAHILDFPATMPPDAHTHSLADLYDLPSTFPPSDHEHFSAHILLAVSPARELWYRSRPDSVTAFGAWTKIDGTLPNSDIMADAIIFRNETGQLTLLVTADSGKLYSAPFVERSTAVYTDFTGATYAGGRVTQYRD